MTMSERLEAELRECGYSLPDVENFASQQIVKRTRLELEKSNLLQWCQSEHAIADELADTTDTDSPYGELVQWGWACRAAALEQVLERLK